MKEKKPIHVVLGKLVWLISAARNIIVVVVSAVMAYMFEAHGSQPFILTGKHANTPQFFQNRITYSHRVSIADVIFCISGFVKPGLPTFSPPPFSTQVGNTTYSFMDMTSTMGTAILVVPLLAILENIALAKVFGK